MSQNRQLQQTLYQFLYADSFISFKDIRMGKTFFDFGLLTKALNTEKKVMGRRVTASSTDTLSNLARLKMGKQIITDNFVNALNQGLD